MTTFEKPGRWFAILAPIALLSACASERQAVQLTQDVASASRSALKAVSAIEAVDREKTEGLIEARAQLRALLDQQKLAAFEKARLQWDAAYVEAQARLREVAWEALTGLETERAAARESLAKAISAERSAVGAQLAKLLAERDELARKASEAPQDLDRHEAAVLAEGRYYHFAALALRDELKLTRESQEALDQAYAKAATDVGRALDAKLQALAQVHRDLAKRLAPLPATGADQLGPDPTHPDQTFASLTEYVKAVEEAQGVLEDWIEASSLNPYRNSLIKEFTASIAKGAYEGLTGETKAPDSKALLESYESFFRSQLDRNVLDLSDARTKAVEDLVKTGREVGEKAIAATSEALSRRIAELASTERKGTEGTDR